MQLVSLFIPHGHFKGISKNQLPIPWSESNMFWNSVKVLTREFSTFAIKSLQTNTYDTIEKLNLINI